MEPRSPAAFPLDDRRVYDGYIASRVSAALAVGVRLGLFDLLERGARTEDEVARALELAPRGARALLAALAAYGVLVRAGEHYGLAPDASAYLVRGKPGSLWGLIDMEVEHFLSPAALLEALRSGKPSVYGADDPWQRHLADPRAVEAFTAAMHSVSERPAAGFAEVAPLAGTRSLLDVGGGSGALSLALLRAHPELECTVLDLAPVCALARRYAHEAGLGARLSTHEADMFRDPFPAGHDALLLSQILHDWTPETGRALVAKAHAALPIGGRLLIHEKLVEESGEAPLANVLVHLDMLVWTEGQQYRASELRELCAEAGFGAIEVRASAGYWSTVSAVKQA